MNPSATSTAPNAATPAEIPAALDCRSISEVMEKTPKQAAMTPPAATRTTALTVPTLVPPWLVTRAPRNAASPQSAGSIAAGALKK